MPTLIIRGGRNDSSHPKRTSMEVHCLIPQSELVEPPWPEDAWEQQLLAHGDGTGNLFDPWVQAAPLLLAFAERHGPFILPGWPPVAARTAGGGS